MGVYPARNIEVLLLADFADSALSGIELLDEGLANFVRFATENPHFFPLATALVEYATAWAGVQAQMGWLRDCGEDDSRSGGGSPPGEANQGARQAEEKADSGSLFCL